MKVIHWVAVAVLVVNSAALVSADGPRGGSAAPSDGVFKSSVDLVALNVTVTNRSDKHIPGLQASDFVVLEDGVRQSVTFFSTSAVPLDLAVLMDASASMQGKIALSTQAAAGLVRSLRPGDRATVVEFRDAVRVRQPLTADMAAVESAIQQISPGGSTSLYDAIYIALKELAKAQHDPQEVRRQAIVLLSDGDDNASLIGYDDVRDLARRGGVVVYTVSLKSQADLNREHLEDGGRRFLGQADYAMTSLAQDTGGRAFFPKEPSQLKEIYDSIAEELGYQYALGYVPTNARRDGAWRRVAIQVLAADARPRTRTGYYAVAETPARTDNLRP